MSTFDLPENVSEIESMGAVELPFNAPILYWRSGNDALENMEEIKGVPRFGGWAIQLDQIDPFPSLPPLPKSFEKTVMSGKDGKYENYLSREIKVAVFVRRFAWFDKSVTQYLGYLKDFGPVILQAKSTTGIDLDDAVKHFKKATAEVRGQAPESLFYMNIGSFGNSPLFVKKTSKGGAESRVTVPKVQSPKGGFTSQTIEYVGKEVASSIIEMQKQAKAWADDWAKRREVRQNTDTLPELPPPSDEFPFN